MNGAANFCEDSIADLQVFDKVVVGVVVISDLELPPSMPVLVFFLTNWNDEVIYYFLIWVVEVEDRRVVAVRISTERVRAAFAYHSAVVPWECLLASEVCYSVVRFQNDSCWAQCSISHAHSY